MKTILSILLCLIIFYSCIHKRYHDRIINGNDTIDVLSDGKNIDISKVHSFSETHYDSVNKMTVLNIFGCYDNSNIDSFVEWNGVITPTVADSTIYWADTAYSMHGLYIDTTSSIK